MHKINECMKAHFIEIIMNILAWWKQFNESYIRNSSDQKNYLNWIVFAEICCYFSWQVARNGNLLPKLFWPTVRKNCSTDREKLLKFEAEGREFAKILRSLEQFVRTVKGQNNFW